MTNPIHRFKHLTTIWDRVKGASSPDPVNQFLFNESQQTLPNFDPFALLKASAVNSASKEIKDLITFCDGTVIPTEPKYIKFLKDKKRNEVLNMAQASAAYQNLSKFTLFHLVLASSIKDEELIKLILKNGLGPESVSHQLGVPLVISTPKEEVKPDEVCRWIINHSIENEISIFDAICHFICETKQITQFGVEPGLIIEFIKNPFQEESIFWIESLPKHLS